MAAVSSILCPVDFSEGSRAALCYAAALADYFGARLTVIVRLVEPESQSHRDGTSLRWHARPADGCRDVPGAVVHDGVGSGLAAHAGA